MLPILVPRLIVKISHIKCATCLPASQTACKSAFRCFVRSLSRPYKGPCSWSPCAMPSSKTQECERCKRCVHRLCIPQHSEAEGRLLCPACYPTASALTSTSESASASAYQNRLQPTNAESSPAEPTTGPSPVDSLADQPTDDTTVPPSNGPAPAPDKSSQPRKEVTVPRTLARPTNELKKFAKRKL